jgi:predicted ester cyclase
MTTLEQEHKDIARQAIEEVCARGDFDKAERYYSPHFRDRVNDLEFHGLEGVRKSVTLYRSVFPDLEIQVVDQVVERDRVVSRWSARGTNRGRRATLDGITISHIEDGKIAEDWTISDSLGLLRQLGPLRAAALLAGQVRDRLTGRASGE